MRLTRSGRCMFPRWIVFTVVLFVLSSLPTGLPLTRQVNAASGNSQWFLTSSSNTNEVCVGDKILFLVQWQTNFNYEDPDSPQGEQDTLAPLTGPVKILAKANFGSFDPSAQTPGSGAGITDFTYTAEEEGPDTVTFQAFNDHLEVDSTATKTFEVKECDYQVTLYVKDNLFNETDRGPVAFYHILQATGTLKNSEPKNPILYEVFDIEVTDASTVTQTADCTYNNPDYAYSSGRLDIKAIREQGGGITVRIGPPRDYSTQQSTVIKCPKSDPQNIFVNSKSNITGDPWIKTFHPTGEGKETIDSVSLNPGLSVLTELGYSLTSDAYVVLKKVPK